MPTAFGSVALQRRTPWSYRVVTVQMGPSPCECGKEMWPSPCGCGVGAAQVLQGNVTQSVPAQMWREAQSDLEDVIACVDVRVGDLDQVLRTLAGDTLQMVPASTELCSVGLAGCLLHVVLRCVVRLAQPSLQSRLVGACTTANRLLPTIMAYTFPRYNRRTPHTRTCAHHTGSHRTA